MHRHPERARPSAPTKRGLGASSTREFWTRGLDSRAGLGVPPPSACVSRMAVARAHFLRTQNSNLSGVEQLKRRMREAERKAALDAKPKCKRYQTRQELEESMRAMFERDRSAKARLNAYIQKKVDEQQAKLAPKKSTTSVYERQVRLQQLSIPNRKPPRMPTTRANPKPAWFAGRRREPSWETESGRAVH